MRLTYLRIEEGKSSNGGWSRAQAKILGVAWPLKRGWNKQVVGGIISDADFKRFVELKDKHLVKTYSKADDARWLAVARTVGEKQDATP